MKRKRLCIDVNSIVPLYVRGYLSGVGRTTYELIQAMSAYKDEYPFEVLLYSQNMKGLGVKNLNLGFASKHVYLPNREGVNKLIQWSHLKDIFVKSDLIHIPHNFEVVRSPNRTIFTFHDALMYTCLDEFPPEAYKMAYKMIPPVMHQSKAIITCSESTKRDLEKYMGIDPNKIYVTPWGVRHDLFHPVEDKGKIQDYLRGKYNIKRPYFFAVSCSHKRKNTPQLIHSYLKMLKNNPENDLVLIWQNYGKDIEDLILQSKGRIHTLSGISDEELSILYSGATATFYPSKYEGFGLPVLESMACGTPVVTCNNSSLPEVGGDAAIYIETEQVGELDKVMDQLEQSNFDLKLLREKSLKQASLFQWGKCAIQTMSLYNNFLQK